MTVEIKQSDSPEERERKMKDFWDHHQKKAEEMERERRTEILELFGSIKIDFDPVEWQRKLRSEWD